MPGPIIRVAGKALFQILVGSFAIITAAMIIVAIIGIVEVINALISLMGQLI